MYIKDTIISTITAVSGGSVSIVRISGEDAFSIVNGFFSVDLRKKPGGTFYFGKLFNEDKKVIDDVIAFLFEKPRSYTGENVVEISCHSNIFIIEEIVSLFLANGCRFAEPGEFSKRAFLNGKMDLLQTEAVADLISSKSRASVKNSLSILEGGLSKKIKTLKDGLIEVGSLLELELDFSEEDLEIIPKEKYISTVKTSLNAIGALLKSFNTGRQFQKGVEVLIAGKPNVGKSSLMNAFLEKDRVIVSHLPGTTRDLIHEDLIMGDVLVRLIDTAGIRFTEDLVEAEGVSRAKELLQKTDLILVLIDLSIEIDNDDLQLVSILDKKLHEKIIIVGNKNDKTYNNKTIAYINGLGLEHVFISAKTEKNVQKLKEVILNRIKRSEKSFTEDIVITNQRHFDILTRVKKLLENNLESFEKNEGLEFIASDLRLTINALSEITGEITTDDILNNIFSSFCIGK